MHSSSSSEILKQIAQEDRHWAAAPQAFLDTWKRGVQIAGSRYFGSASATIDHVLTAQHKNALRPNLVTISDDLGVLSGGEQLFLAAMVSFYDAREGGAMLKRCGFEGLSDLGRLDLRRREVIADLLLNYDGW